jgi:hypothetical protein
MVPVGPDGSSDGLGYLTAEQPWGRFDFCQQGWDAPAPFILLQRFGPAADGPTTSLFFFYRGVVVPDCHFTAP